MANTPTLEMIRHINGSWFHSKYRRGVYTYLSRDNLGPLNSKLWECIKSNNRHTLRIDQKGIEEILRKKDFFRKYPYFVWRISRQIFLSTFVPLTSTSGRRRRPDVPLPPANSTPVNNMGLTIMGVTNTGVVGEERNDR